ncbi:ABC transporter permease [bacterium]|nr:ABC transporter permease [bacterium]
MIWSIAWRNVWRNGKRSGILIGAIAFGIWAGLLMVALMNGMAEQQVKAAIETRTSHIQIHSEGFRSHRDIKSIIPQGDSLLTAVRNMDEVVGAAERAVLTAMASSATTGSGIQLIGIDPDAEKQVTDVYTKVIEGDYFETKKRNPVIIGKELADKLGVQLGKKIVLTGQAKDGSIAAGAFRIVGIYQTVNSMYDEMTVFVKRSDVAKTFGIGDDVHEIAIVVNGIAAIDPVAKTLRDSNPSLEVATWRNLSPEVALTKDSTAQMNEIFMIVILIALIFGITNTMLMGVLERMRELGVIIALGMKHGMIFLMVLLETVFLSLVGGLLGIILGWGTVELLGKSGIDLSAVSSGLAAFGMDTVIYPQMAASEYPVVVFLVIITAIVASIYPGLKAIRLNPIQAIRTY